MGAHALPRTAEKPRTRGAHKRSRPRRPWRRRIAVVAGSALACAVLVPLFSPATAEERTPVRAGRAPGSSPTDAALVVPGARPSASATQHRRRPRPRPGTGTTTATPSGSPATTAPAGANPGPSPAPVPSTSAGGRPGPGTTGVPAGTQLTRRDGNLVITQPGAVYDRLDIHGFVVVKAPNVTIRRSVIRGGQTSVNTGLVMVTDPAATHFVLEDSELVPEFPSVHLNAIKGWNYTMRRVDAHGTVDIAEIYGDDVRIESSWLHGNTPYANDPNQHGGPSHDDGIQVEAGHHIAIVGNTISGAHNAALMVTQDAGAVGDLLFSGNWVDGGACAVNANAKPLSSMSGLTINANRFGRDTRIADCSVLSSTTTTIVAQGNVWDDTGLPVRIRTKG